MSSIGGFNTSFKWNSALLILNPTLTLNQEEKIHIYYQWFSGNQNILRFQLNIKYIAQHCPQAKVFHLLVYFISIARQMTPFRKASLLFKFVRYPMHTSQKYNTSKPQTCTLICLAKIYSNRQLFGIKNSKCRKFCIEFEYGGNRTCALISRPRPWHPGRSLSAPASKFQIVSGSGRNIGWIPIP